MKKILIFRTGQIGDFVVSLPAMWNVRRRFPDAELTLLSDVHPREIMVAAPQVLAGSGVVDKFDRLWVGHKGRVSFVSSLLALARIVASHGGRFDAVLDLSPFRMGGPGSARMAFFRLLGRRYFGAREQGYVLDTRTGLVEPEAARLDRIARQLTGNDSDFSDPAFWKLGFGAAETAEFSQVCPPKAAGTIRIAMCCGSKVPAKCWPIGRYAQVLHALSRRVNLEVLVFGGKAEREGADELARYTPTLRNLCGALSPRGSAYGISTCDLYLGNDTGPMHLAAASGVPCVALFSARDQPGKWWPNGSHHKVLWKNVSCGGCMINECLHEGLRCLRDISVTEVVEACETFVARPDQRQKRWTPLILSGISAELKSAASSGFLRLVPPLVRTAPACQINVIVGAPSSSPLAGSSADAAQVIRSLKGAGLLRAIFVLDPSSSDTARGSGSNSAITAQGRMAVALQAGRYPRDFWLCLDLRFLGTALLASRGGGRRFGVFLQSLDFMALTGWERFALRRAGHVVAASEFVAKNAIRWGIERARVCTALIGADDRWREWPVRPVAAQAEAVVVLGWLGRRDGVGSDLIAAGEILRKRHPGFRLLLTGDEESLAAVRAEVVRRDLGAWVSFANAQSASDIAGCWECADVFVAWDDDNLRETHLEAMARGLPSIGSEQNAARELIADGETGFHIPEGNVVALIDALSVVARSPVKRAAMGLAARRRFEQQFDNDGFGSRLLSAVNSWQALSANSR